MATSVDIAENLELEKPNALVHIILPYTTGVCHLIRSAELKCVTEFLTVDIIHETDLS